MRRGGAAAAARGSSTLDANVSFFVSLEGECERVVAWLEEFFFSRMAGERSSSSVRRGSVPGTSKGDTLRMVLEGLRSVLDS